MSAYARPNAIIAYLAWNIRPWALVIPFALIVVVLAALSVAGQYAVFVAEPGTRQSNLLFNLFNLDGERLIPTIFSALLILGNSVLLFFIAVTTAGARGRFPLYWLALAGIFAYLSFDEATKIHEESLDFLMPLFRSDFLHFWVIPASLIMLVLGLVYWRFLFHLPRATRNLFFLSAFIYLGGALGLETLGGLYAEQYGKNNFPYSLLADVEEVAEMTGMIVFGYMLLTYLRSLIAPPPDRRDIR